MKLTPVAKALSVAATRLGMSASVQVKAIALEVVVSPIQLAYEVGLWVLRVNKLDPVGVDDGAGVLNELFVSFFKNKVDNVSLAEEIAFEFYKSLGDEAELSDDQIMTFFKNLVDVASAEDRYAALLSKPTADESFASDATVLGPNKVVNDLVAFADDEVISFYKVLLDPVGLSESFGWALARGFADPFAAFELISVGLNKQLSDRVFGTDDLDGEASILDDQTLQVVKQITNITAVADMIHILLIVRRQFEESTQVADTGSLRSQNYCDFTYFAEDFVGASRTF